MNPYKGWTPALFFFYSIPGIALMVVAGAALWIFTGLWIILPVVSAITLVSTFLRR